MTTIVERNRLIENYLPLANKLAIEKKKSLPSWVSLDDLKSAAYFGLVDAANKFDPERFISFGTYAKWRINGEMLDFIRESCRDTERCSISLDEQDENGVSLASKIPQGVPTENFNEFFEDLTKHLADLDRNILMMYYVEDMSLKEIGGKIGVSESRVSQLLKRSRENVRMTVAA
jgi:RNA polymerase sigma factor (sigma-70 family)